MGLFSRKAAASQPTIQYSEQKHGLNDPGFWVGYVSYCQPQLAWVASQIGWQPSEQPSQAVIGLLKPDRNTPRNPNGMRVEVAGQTIGYTPRANHGQRAGQAPVVLVKQGQDILAWVGTA